MTGDLTVVFPILRRLKCNAKWCVLSRDEVYQLFIVLNELLLGVEATLAHLIGGTLRPYEWIPIIFGPVAALGLGVGYVGRRAGRSWATSLMRILLWGSVIVGTTGTYFHLMRTMRPFAQPGARLTLGLVVWGVPLLAPASFSLVGILGLVTLSRLQPEERKSSLYILLSSLGVAIAAVSSVFDHLRGGFSSPWLWIPTVVGTFGVIVAFFVGTLTGRSRGDLTTYTFSMLALMVVGPLGLVLHVLHDLGAGHAIVLERFLRDAPIMAPMAFANMGLMGLIALLGGQHTPPEQVDEGS
jgi:hypothetical protein